MAALVVEAAIGAARGGSGGAMVRGALLVTDEPMIVAGTERAAAAAGIDLTVVPQIAAAGQWRSARIVLVGTDRLASVVGLEPPSPSPLVVVASAPLVPAQWRDCMTIGAAGAVVLDDEDEALVQHLSDAAARGTTPVAEEPDTGMTVAVTGAAGGAGASVLAAAVAVAAATERRQVLLCDLDPWGAAGEVLLGVETAPGVRWDGINGGRGRLAAASLFRALPEVTAVAGTLSVLAQPDRGPEGVDPLLLEGVLRAVRAAGGTAVVDLPRVVPTAGATALTQADLTVLVVPADVRGCYGAARIVPRLEQGGARVGLVVRGPSPSGIGADDIAAIVDRPVIGTMRPQPGLIRAVDTGAFIRRARTGPLGRTARAVLAAAHHRHLERR